MGSKGVLALFEGPSRANPGSLTRFVAIDIVKVYSSVSIEYGHELRGLVIRSVGCRQL